MKTLIIAALALGVVGCSATQSNPFETFIRNITAAQCANPQAALANIPLTFITPAQALEAVEGVCVGIFGTVAAPTPAPGMSGAFPAPTPVPAK